MNQLYLGDCLDVLRKYIKDESVDLIYIDPPFNSKRNYNIFFDDKEIQTQRVAFEDTWSYKSVGASLLELQTVKNEPLHTLLNAYKLVAPQVFPYLVMMTLRILELHRVLKETGSFYLHCDPTASHYLKTICDAVFGVKNFRNEIVWRRKGGSALKGMRIFSNATDFILFYTKTDNYLYNTTYIPLDQDYIEEHFTKIDENGRRFQATVMRSPNPRPNLMYDYKGYKMPPNGWAVSREKMELLDKEGKLYFPENKTKQIYRKIFLDEYPGQPANNLWTNISTLKGKSLEKLGYPTQKPRALLERIIQASSNEGDLILDGFCGCGTTLDASEFLRRKWIGIDISPIAIGLMKLRLQDSYKTDLSKFTIRGVPKDKESAIELWVKNPFAFQDWWIMEFEVFSSTFGKKGADQGVDGLGMYLIPTVEQPIKAAFQVKGGKVQSKDIDALLGAMVKHKCELGVFLTIQSPTEPMLKTVANSGHFSAAGFNYPRLQILTLEEFFSGKTLQLPKFNITFKNAQSISKFVDQSGLDL